MIARHNSYIAWAVSTYLFALFISIVVTALISSRYLGSADSTPLRFDNPQILVGEGSKITDGIRITALHDNQALIRFQATNLTASNYEFFVHKVSSPTKLLDIRLFWTTSQNPEEFRTLALYPGGHKSYTRLTKADGWKGMITELGIAVSSATGTKLPLDRAITITQASLEPPTLSTSVLGMLEGWVRFWGWDNRTINSAVPRKTLKPSTPPIAVIGAAMLLSLAALFLFSRRYSFRAAFVVLLSAWATFSMLWLIAVGSHLRAGHSITDKPIYDGPLVRFLGRARSYIPECSESIRLVIYGKNTYLTRRASYLLRPCNAATGRYLVRGLTPETYIMVIHPSRAKYAQEAGQLRGLGQIASVERIFTSQFGDFYRITDGSD